MFVFLLSVLSVFALYSCTNSVAWCIHVKVFLEFPCGTVWVCHYHYNSMGCCGGVSSNPGLRTSTLQVWQKNFKKDIFARYRILHTPFFSFCILSMLLHYLFVCLIYLFIYFDLLSFQGCSRAIWKFLGQGSNQSYSCQSQPTPQLLVYTTATAMLHPSHVCDLHHSSQQYQIFKPLSKAKDQTHNLMVSSWIHFHCAMTGTPLF